MLFRKKVSVTGIASTEVLATALTGQQNVKTVIRKVYFTETTATLLHDAVLSFYIDQLHIVDMHYAHFLLTNASDNRQNLAMLEFNQELLPGQTFKVGILSSATLSTFDFAIEFDETR